MRKCVAIIILVIMLVNGAGFYVYYAMQLQQIRYEMRTTLKHAPDHTLEVLKMTRQEFQNAKADQYEVKVHGKMYDVAKVAIVGNEVWVYAKHDEKEDNLVSLLNHIVSAPLDHKHAIPLSFIQYLTLIFEKPSELSWLSIVGFDRGVNKFHYFFSLITFTTSPEAMPPWVSIRSSE